MSQAGEGLQPVGSGKAIVRVPERQGADPWADLRPAAAWLEGRRPVLVGALILIAIQVAWRAQFLSDMYFYRQDFFNLDFASKSPFSWHYLTYVGTGHLMIGERAIIWVLTRVSLYDWGLASAVSLAFLAAAGIAAFRVLRTLFGERPAILVPLAIYLLTPLTVAALGWWTVALESIPLQFAMFMAINSHIHYVRTKRTRHLVAATIWVVLGLLAFEKGLVVPILLLAITAAFLAGGGSWLAGLGRVLVRYWKAWLIYAVAIIGYAIVLIASLRTSSTHPVVPTGSAAASFAWGMLKGSLLPGAIGGPWQWWVLPGQAYALAAPPVELTWLAFIVAGVVVGASVLRRRASWRAWAIFAIWVVLADMLPVIIGRLNWYPALLSLDTRYVADAVPVLALCLSLAFLPIVTGADARPQRAEASEVAASNPSRYRGGPAHAWRSAASGVVAVIVVGSIWSAAAYQSKITGSTAASYIATATAAVEQAPGGTTVLDGAVPDQLKDGSYGTRAVLGVIRPGGLRWIEHPAGTIDRLQMFGPDGRLYPAWVYGVSTGRPTAPLECWPQRHGRIVLTFYKSPPAPTNMLRIGYIWGATSPGVVQVSYGKTTRNLAVRPGLHTAYLTVAGAATHVTVSGLGGTRMCIGDAEAGSAQPNLSGQVQS